MKAKERRERERELQKSKQESSDGYKYIDRPLYNDIYAKLLEARQYTKNDSEHISTLLSVWGDSGVGKTGIVSQLEKKLKADRIPFCSIPLNKDIFSKTNSKDIIFFDEIVGKHAHPQIAAAGAGPLDQPQMTHMKKIENAHQQAYIILFTVFRSHRFSPSNQIQT